jgi:hypothetical protein
VNRENEELRMTVAEQRAMRQVELRQCCPNCGDPLCCQNCGWSA